MAWRWSPSAIRPKKATVEAGSSSPGRVVFLMPLIGYGWSAAFVVIVPEGISAGKGKGVFDECFRRSDAVW